MKVFPKYPAYKDSGVAWLGEVPEHWEVEKGIRYFFETESRSTTGDEELLSVSHLTGVTPRSEKNITMFMAESYEGSKLCEVGDIAVNTMWAWMAALGVSRYRGLVSPSYGTYRQKKPERFNPTFLDHLIRTDVYRSHYTVNSTGITTSRLRLYPHSFLRLKFVCPPRAEQDRIVAFLDEKTAQIAALIAKKQRQIELLDEQKAILINRAVTRGLHPNPDLQDSGIPWIGPIPKAWKVIKFRRLLAAIEQGASPNAVQDNLDPNQWKVITLSAVKQGVFYPEAFKPISPSTEGKFSNTLRVGDFLLTRANTRTLVGDVCIVESVLANTTFSDLVYRLRFNQPNKAQYLKCFLLSQAARCQIERDARGSNETMVKISHGHINEWDVVLPSESEMNDVVAHTAALEKSTSVAIRAFESQIQTLQTLRSTLIAHAVTGKIAIPAATA